MTIPDFPGCFSAADDWQDLPRMVQEAIELWCEGEDLELPEPTPIEKLVKDPEYFGGVWLLIDVDTSKLETKAVRINISLPQGLKTYFKLRQSRYTKTSSTQRPFPSMLILML